MAQALRLQWIPRTDDQRAVRWAKYQRFKERRSLLRRNMVLQYVGDCICTHEGAIRPECMAGIFGVVCGSDLEFTPTGCEFDTLTLLEKRPARA